MITNFIKGYSGPPAPSPPKKRKTDKEKKAKKREYEQRRERKYQIDWEKTYDWVEYNADENKMYCKICLTYEPESKGTFVTGCNNFKPESLKAHHTATRHEYLVKVHEANLAKEQNVESVADKTLKKINDHTIGQLKILFTVAHSLAKQGRPFTDFTWQTSMSLGKNNRTIFEVESYD